MRKNADDDISDQELIELDRYNPAIAYFGVLLSIFVGTILVQSPWAAFHGAVFIVIGLLAILFPPIKKQASVRWVLASLFVVCSLAVFLPADLFGRPEWRAELENVGIKTGDLVAIQWRQALEGTLVFTVVLLTGLWLAGHRASPKQLRLLALLFIWGVAIYAIASWLVFRYSEVSTETFGFLPNRNHTATYLAMGVVCGLGSILQAARDKRFIALASALFATCICLWAAGAWSISRAGILLISIGSVTWLSMLGRRYLGKQGIWAVGLLAVFAAGVFLVSDSVVKRRISETVGKTITLVEESQNEDGSKRSASMGLDFRIPTAVDTLDLIRDHAWTGVGANQFYYVFPQYRNLTSVINHADNHHPESDWLWMISETGIPATICLAVLVVLAFWKGAKSVFSGSDRALRASCLVAAALVPLHGIFDVPGHRITIAIAALFLYSLSLGSLSSNRVARIPFKLPHRLSAFCILALGVTFFCSHLFGKPSLSTISGDKAMLEAKRLYRIDQIRLKKSEEMGMEYQPDPSEDLLEKSIKVLHRASEENPLDRQIPRYIAFIAFHFDDKQDEIERAFAKERALDPTWVKGPYEQGIAWGRVEPDRVLRLWEEAMSRASRADELDPGNSWSRKRTLERMEKSAKRYPALKSSYQHLSE